MSRRTIPASSLAKLSLGDRETMRSSNTGMAQRNPSSQASSSRAPVRSSRGNASQATSRCQESTDDSSSEEDSSDDSDDSDVDSSDEEVQDRRRRKLYQQMSVFDPGLASPRELAAATGQSSEATHTHALANTLHSMAHGDNRQHLRQLPQVGSHFWARQLAANLRRRFDLICQDLYDNVRNPAMGQDVVATIDSLRALFVAIDNVRDDHFRRLQFEEQQLFVRLEIAILKWIFQHNTDLYGGAPRRPAFAGAAIQAESRPFQRWISVEGQPIMFLQCLLRLDSALLRPELIDIHALYGVLLRYLESVPATDPDREHVHRVAQAAWGVYQKAETR